MASRLRINAQYQSEDQNKDQRPVSVSVTTADPQPPPVNDAFQHLVVQWDRGDLSQGRPNN